MIIIIRILYACLIVSTINALLFFWPVTFFLGWSFISYKFFFFSINRILDFLSNLIVLNNEPQQKRLKKFKFESEEEKKLYYITKFNTFINKTMPQNIDLQADISKYFRKNNPIIFSS